MAIEERLNQAPTRKRRRVPTWALVGLAIVIVLAAFIFMGYTSFSQITGFGGPTVTKTTEHSDTGAVDTTVEKQEPRKIWDWISLLGVGSAVALVGYVFARKQKERDEAVASDRAQEEAIQSYLSQMSNLMIDQRLGKKRYDGLEDSVRKVAQARTIATLLALDKDHKRRPLKLTYELGLIQKEANGKKPIINLRNAALDHADLRELSLRDACLSGVDLRVTDLSGSNLSGADLSSADLRGANLTNADLSGADLTDANLLPYDELQPAKLSIHNLKDEAGSSSEDELRFSRIKPTITPTNLSNCNLEGANLSGTILGNIDLRSVRGLTQEQLKQAIGNQATRLEKGLKPPEARRTPA